MINVNKEVKFAKLNTKAQIEIQIEMAKNEISNLQSAFNSNPSKKTATPLSAAKQKLTFLRDSMYYTAEAKTERGVAAVHFNLEIREFLQVLKNA